MMICTKGNTQLFSGEILNITIFRLNLLLNVFIKINYATEVKIKPVN